MIKEEVKEYFNGDDLAAEVFLNKYSLDSKETPDNMHLRLAKEFARIEVKDHYEKGSKFYNDKHHLLSDYGKSREFLGEEQIYELFKDFKYIVPQGSIMYGLGRKDKYISLSNCFFIGRPMDSYSGIFQKDQEAVQLYKRRGGVGLDISDLRPSGTIVSNSADTSTGAISFMERFSNSARETGQNGRRAALMLTIDINHPDVEQFATIKSDLSKVTGANISIKLNREFMEAVENNEDYILRFPCNKTEEDVLGYNLKLEDLDYNILKRGFCVNTYYKKIKAKELWNTIVKQARNNAEPGLLFWDNVIDYGPDSVYDEYRPQGTNPLT